MKNPLPVCRGHRATFFTASLWLLGTVGYAQTASPTPPADATKGKAPPPAPTSVADTNMLTAPRRSMSDNNVSWLDRRFLKKVAEDGQREFALADLAAEQATNPELRSFAQQLAIADRERLERFTKLAVKKGQQKEIAEYALSAAVAVSLAAPEASGASATVATAPAPTVAKEQPALKAAASAPANTGKTASGNDRTKTGTVAASTSEMDRGSASNSDAAKKTDAAKKPSPPQHTEVAAKTDVAAKPDSAKQSAPTKQADVAKKTDAPKAGSSPAPATSDTAASDTMRTTKRPTFDESDWNDPKKDRAYRKLADKSGADFDKEYVSMLVSDREDQIAQFEREAEKASDTDVQAFARDELPKMREQLARARTIAAAIKS